MKFTEEQYQKIVEIVNKYPNFGKQYSVPNGGEGEPSTTYRELINGIFGSIYRSEKQFLEVQYMLALANPLTREWAHDKFVEKEKKYYWKLNGLYLIKDHSDGSIIFDSYKNLFTESEIKEWGYNPDMFDREEV